MGKLEEMRDRLNRIDDVELLEVAKDLLSEMAEVQRLKEQIEMKEDSFTEGKRAAFYFFAMGLDPEQLAHATNTAIGRIRFLKEKKEREQTKAELDGEVVEKEEESTEFDNQSVNNSFGGLGSSFGGASGK